MAHLFRLCLRALSFNTKLLRLAVVAAQKVGATVTHINLRDYPLPIYDADLVARDGIPQLAADLRNNFEDHPGLIVASPEYNGSVTALLKNSTLDTSCPFGNFANSRTSYCICASEVQGKTTCSSRPPEGMGCSRHGARTAPKARRRTSQSNAARDAVKQIVCKVRARGAARAAHIPT
jgi:hypothetical protein